MFAMGAKAHTRKTLPMEPRRTPHLTSSACFSYRWPLSLLAQRKEIGHGSSEQTDIGDWGNWPTRACRREGASCQGTAGARDDEASGEGRIAGQGRSRGRARGSHEPGHLTDGAPRRTRSVCHVDPVRGGHGGGGASGDHAGGCREAGRYHPLCLYVRRERAPNPGIPHFDSKWKVEQHIRQIGLPATILRPVWFMENFTTVAKPSAEGVLMLPMKPARKLAMVALKDIGEFGAAAFLRPNDFLGQAIDLAGDELTMSETAAQLTHAMGRPIRFQEFPMEQAEAVMAHDLTTMFRWFNEVGYAIDIPTLKQKFQIPLTTFAEWIKTVDWTKG